MHVPCFEAVYAVAENSDGGAVIPYMDAMLMMFPLPVLTPNRLFNSQSFGILLRVAVEWENRVIFPKVPKRIMKPSFQYNRRK